MNLNSEQKGRRGQEILDDAVFVEMVETARTEIMTQWNLTDFEQTEMRESLYHQGRALDEMLRGLRTLVGDWAIAQSRKKTKKGMEI
jgi:hypothetical protein